MLKEGTKGPAELHASSSRLEPGRCCPRDRNSLQLQSEYFDVGRYVMPLRIGVLGTAQIVAEALLQPSSARAGDVRVEAVASRDGARARVFAERWGIPRAYGGYEALAKDPDLDVIYIATPNRFHVQHCLLALRAGRSVLCEKPLALDEAGVEAVRGAVPEGRWVMEGFHYIHHPFAQAALSAVRSGRLGRIIEVSAGFCLPVKDPKAIHWRAELGGGAASNLGVYPLHFGRALLGEEPLDIVQRRTLAADPGYAGAVEVESAVEATFRCPSGARLRIEASQAPSCAPLIQVEVVGTKGRLHVENPFLPHRFHHEMVLETAVGDEERIRFPEALSTFDYQLEALVQRARDQEPGALDDAWGNARALRLLRGL